MLAEALRQIGHPQIRNRGTVCGSLAHNDPQAELPAVAVALDAAVVIRSTRGVRRIDASGLFTGPFSTTVADDEVIEAVEFPVHPPAWAFEEFAARPGDFALAGVAAASDRSSGGARVVMFGVGGGPERAPLVESALAEGTEPGEAIALTVGGLTSSDDVHASAAGRRTIMAKLLTDADRLVRERAGNEASA